MTTRWSVVAAAGQKRTSESREALATLCESYWYPLYAYVRRCGYAREEAQDLTQGFFTRLVESDTLQVADPNRGRFRSFLLSSLKNFASNEWRDAQTLKRGGGLVQRSFNLDSGEHQYSQEPSHELTPERIFERRWAMLVLERALANLSDEFTASGKKELFEQLKFYLTGDPLSAHYREVAAKLGISEGAVKVAVHRLRRRYQECLRAEIAETVAESSQIDDELRALFTAVAS